MRLYPSSKTKRSTFPPVVFLVLLQLFLFCQHNPEPLPRLTADDFRPNTVLVPAGWFWMGSDEGEPDEKPLHRVWVDSFRIDVYPVTNEQYLEFVRETGHRKPRYGNNDGCNHPLQAVVGVSWDDAFAFCAWRSKKEGVHYRLPTEAEWEKAARGVDKRRFPWGEKKPSPRHANTKLKENMPTVGMCDLGTSPYGCLDMVGNVWQWCEDWYAPEYYRMSPDSNPSGPRQPTRGGRVVRGGNWVFLGCCSGSPAYALRCAQRNSFHPNIRKKSIGFRCVREITEGKEAS